MDPNKSSNFEMDVRSPLREINISNNVTADQDNSPNKSVNLLDATTSSFENSVLMPATSPENPNSPDVTLTNQENQRPRFSILGTFDPIYQKKESTDDGKTDSTDLDLQCVIDESVKNQPEPSEVIDESLVRNKQNVESVAACEVAQNKLNVPENELNKTNVSNVSSVSDASELNNTVILSKSFTENTQNISDNNNSNLSDSVNVKTPINVVSQLKLNETSSAQDLSDSFLEKFTRATVISTPTSKHTTPVVQDVLTSSPNSTFLKEEVPKSPLEVVNIQCENIFPGKPQKTSEEFDVQDADSIELENPVSRLEDFDTDSLNDEIESAQNEILHELSVESTKILNELNKTQDTFENKYGDDNLPVETDSNENISFKILNKEDLKSEQILPSPIVEAHEEVVEKHSSISFEIVFPSVPDAAQLEASVEATPVNKNISFVIGSESETPEEINTAIQSLAEEIQVPIVETPKQKLIKSELFETVLITEEISPKKIFLSENITVKEEINSPVSDIIEESPKTSAILTEPAEELVISEVSSKVQEELVNKPDPIEDLPITTPVKDQIISDIIVESPIKSLASIQPIEEPVISEISPIVEELAKTVQSPLKNQTETVPLEEIESKLEDKPIITVTEIKSPKKEQLQNVTSETQEILVKPVNISFEIKDKPSNITITDKTEHMSEANPTEKSDVSESAATNRLSLDTNSVPTNEMGEVINQNDCFQKQTDITNGAVDNKETLDAKNEMYNEMVERLSLLESECEKYKIQVAELKKELKTCRQKSISLESEVADLKRRENELNILLEEIKNKKPDTTDSEEKDEELKLLQTNEETLKNEIKELKVLVKQHENKLKELQQKEVKLADDLTSKTQSELQISRVMEEYEKSISSLVAENEKMKKERDTAQMHLANIELAFSDVHQKYERCKQIVQGYKDNEESFRQDIAMNRETISTQEQKYATLKAHAMAQLEKSNQELCAIKKQHETEMARLTAQLKRYEIKNDSLMEALQQKTKECEQLSAVCDEFIGNV